MTCISYTDASFLVWIYNHLRSSLCGKASMQDFFKLFSIFSPYIIISKLNALKTLRCINLLTSTEDSDVVSRLMNYRFGSHVAVLRWQSLEEAKPGGGGSIFWKHWPQKLLTALSYGLQISVHENELSATLGGSNLKSQSQSEGKRTIKDVWSSLFVF